MFYLDDAEYEALERKVKTTSLSREGFIRKAIQNAQIYTAPPVDLPMFIREIRRIGINIDQILRIAYTKAPLQVPDFKKALTNLSKLEDKIDAVYYGGIV